MSHLLLEGMIVPGEASRYVLSEMMSDGGSVFDKKYQDRPAAALDDELMCGDAQYCGSMVFVVETFAQYGIP